MVQQAARAKATGCRMCCTCQHMPSSKALLLSTSSCSRLYAGAPHKLPSNTCREHQQCWR
eukprot:1161220-Pelagomonas_calceolata.AAC.14